MQGNSDQHFWNFLFSVLYAGLLGFAIYDIYNRTGGAGPYFSTLDLIIIPLAVFRIIRLFSYDKITEWFRNLFKRRTIVMKADGSVMVQYVPYSRGPFRTMSDLLQCPWCTGVWASLAVVYLYATISWFWLVLFILAVSGVASFIQLVANAIGWRAERLKQKVISDDTN